MNAVYELITRDSRKPSAKMVYRVGVGVGLLIAVLMTGEMLFRFPQYPLVSAAIYGSTSVIVLTLPAIIAAVSAIVTARHVRRIDWGVLTTTPITRSDVMWGFVRGALYQCRVILAVSLPLLVIDTLGWLADLIERGYAYSICVGNCYQVNPVTGYRGGWTYSPYVIDSTLHGGVLNLATFVTALAAVSIGTFFGLSNRTPVIAPALATLVSFTCIILPFVCILYVVSHVAGDIPGFKLFGLPVLNFAGLIFFNAAQGIVLKRHWKIPT